MVYCALQLNGNTKEERLLQSFIEEPHITVLYGEATQKQIDDITSVHVSSIEITGTKLWKNDEGEYYTGYTVDSDELMMVHRTDDYPDEHFLHISAGSGTKEEMLQLYNMLPNLTGTLYFNRDVYVSHIEEEE